MIYGIIDIRKTRQYCIYVKAPLRQMPRRPIRASHTPSYEHKENNKAVFLFPTTPNYCPRISFNGPLLILVENPKIIDR